HSELARTGRIPSPCVRESAPDLSGPLQTSCSFCLSTFTFIDPSHDPRHPLFPLRRAAAVRDENKIHRHTILPWATFRCRGFGRCSTRNWLWARAENKSLDSISRLSDEPPARAENDGANLILSGTIQTEELRRQ